MSALLDGEAGAALLPAPSDDGAPAAGAHPAAKSVAPLTTPDFWLIGSLHSPPDKCEREDASARNSGSGRETISLRKRAGKEGVTGSEWKDFAGLGGDFGFGIHGGHGSKDVVEDGVGVGGVVGDAGEAKEGGLVEVVVADLGDGDVETIADAFQHALDHPAFALEGAVTGQPQVYGDDADYHDPSVRGGERAADGERAGWPGAWVFVVLARVWALFGLGRPRIESFLDRGAAWRGGDGDCRVWRERGRDRSSVHDGLCGEPDGRRSFCNRVSVNG